MAKANRMKTVAHPTPQSRDEAEQLLKEIGQLQREVTRVEASMNDELSNVKHRYEAQAAPMNDELTAKFKALHAWAEVHRDDLLTGRSKTVKLATGELNWRVTPPKVSLRGQDTVVAALAGA